MLCIFLANYRDALIDRCLIKVARRSGAQTEYVLSTASTPMFLDQLIQTLKFEQVGTLQTRSLAPGSTGGPSNASGPGKAITRRGCELSYKGFTVEQVVHDYGDLCQAIMDLALELEISIEVEEFRIFNHCLDNAIADAVTELSNQQRLINDGIEQQALTHRAGMLAHDLRVHINAAVHSHSSTKSGQTDTAGVTPRVLDRSLKGMSILVDRTFAEAKINAKLPVSQEVVLVDELLKKIKNSAAFDASAKK